MRRNRSVADVLAFAWMSARQLLVGVRADDPRALVLVAGELAVHAAGRLRRCPGEVDDRAGVGVVRQSAVRVRGEEAAHLRVAGPEQLRVELVHQGQRQILAPRVFEAERGHQILDPHPAPAPATASAPAGSA